MSDSPPVEPAPVPPSKTASRGVSRTVGLGISAVTALLVFAAGGLMFPAQKAPPPTVAVAPSPPPSPPSPPPTPAPPPPTPDSGVPSPAGLVDASAGAADGAAQGTEKAPRIAVADSEPSEAATGDDEPAGKKSKRRKGKDKDKDKDKDKQKDDGGTSAKSARGGSAKPGDAGGGTDKKDDNRPLPPSDGTAPLPQPESSKSKEVEADCALAERDMAREAWHRNRPAVCPIGSTGKAFILIPIKGSIEGASHELHGKSKREARVTLAAGSESQLTMKQYKLKKLGFKELWVSNEESGARLRVKLQPGAGDPVFELKDGYAKITVATPQ